MANANFTTEGSMAQHIPVRETVAEFALGDVSHGNANTLWLYGQAAEAITAPEVVAVDAAFQITVSVSGTFTADVDMLDNDIGWVRVTAGAAPLT